MDYKDFKGLPRRAASDKMLLDKAFNIATFPTFIHKFLTKKFCHYTNAFGGAILNRQ